MKRGDTKLKSLRETYGADFAAGLPGNMPLAVLRAATGMSLTKMLASPEKTEEAAARIKDEKHLVRLYEDGPGAGGGYPPVAQVDGPGNGGGYPPFQSILPDGTSEPDEEKEGPGNGGGYPPDATEEAIDGPGNGGGYLVPQENVDGPGNGGGYPPFQSIPPKKDEKKPDPEPEKKE